MIKLKIDKEIESNCDLGEGLYVKNDVGYWVDINLKKVFIYNNKKDELHEYSTSFIPSLIFKIEDSFVYIAGDDGIYRLDQNTSSFSKLKSFKPSKLRSNDGIFIQDKLILGFMDKFDNDNPGVIKVLSNNFQDEEILIKKIHIPNSFINITDKKILVTDSYYSNVYILDLDKNMRLIKKKNWLNINQNIAPDGGCICNQKIYLTMWDDASIYVYNLNRKLVEKIDMPVKRPTNCKIDAINSKIWVTSAIDGMQNLEKINYPKSGNTFIFNIDL